MNYTKYIKCTLFAAMLAVVGGGLSSCEDNIDLGSADAGALESVNGVYVSLNNVESQRAFQKIKVYNDKKAEASIVVRLTRAANETINCQVALDEALVAEYNAKNETEFEMYPADLVSLENNGVVAVAPGDKESFTIKMSLSSPAAAASLTGKSYMLPVTVTTKTNGVKVRDDKQSYIYIVSVEGNRPNAAKDSGIVTNMYFEVNDTNILNAGEWTLKTSGKPMADIVCIFAANINYNADQGRVYLSFNENVTAILNARDHYIKPLQDKGIKVTMSVLGNHDAAGVANLAPETCISFAKEIKAAVDAYGLDGIEFDDEYSNYGAANGIPGFVSASSDAYARLCYECKRLMPDKIVGVYHYGNAGFSRQVNGVNPGDFIDYIYEAFYYSLDDRIYSAYLGATRSQVAPYSRKIYSGFSYDYDEFQKVREEYGVNMLYNYQTSRVASYLNGFGVMTKILYGEDVVYSGTSHPKDY